MIASSLPKWRARSLAVASPTWRMPRPNRKRGKVVCLDFSSAASRFCADLSAMRSRLASAFRPSRYRSGKVLITLPSTSWSTSFSPRPSMSMRAALREMQDRLLALGAAEQAAGAAVVGLALLAHGLGAAHRAAARHGEQLRARARACPGTTRHHLGDHVAGAPHDHGVAHPHVLAPGLVLVVQRGVGHGDAADEHRRQPRHRRQLAGAARRTRRWLPPWSSAPAPGTCAPPPSAARA